ncbi:hypothetical protein GCM10007301_47560 [Azorhizobium oxalatiphilum]|uniref:Sarcosine oxidase subunit gamma n=1 Tax=Azorhizobium oxalatiphilum TaxID=980631 RepID=A0A917CBN8_9HYPH|nr:sarcosine oxidase subunit gamma family protein [Azorhizobium oxalatiphilum]GGF81921.1 hypothetical protein GCM10007301_47560 [Azorhizobium oxalatiphilum]
MSEALLLVRPTPAEANLTQLIPLGPATRFALHVFGVEAVPTASAGGFDLSGPVGSCRKMGARVSLHLSLHEWRLIAPPSETRHMVAEIQSDLGGVVTSLVEISRRNVSFQISGPNARAILNDLILLDLSDNAFPAGAATLALLGSADVVLVRPGPEALYYVECARKLGPYVQDMLTEATHAFL